MNFYSLAVSVSSLALFALPGSAATFIYAFDVIAATEESAGPGLWTGLGTPVINDAGQIAFAGAVDFADGRGERQVAVRTEGTGAFTFLAVEGEAAPGSVGETYGQLFGAQINEAGDVAWRTTLSGTPFALDDAIYVSDGDAAAPIFRGVSVVFGAFRQTITDPFSYDGFAGLTPVLTEAGDVIHLRDILIERPGEQFENFQDLVLERADGTSVTMLSEGDPLPNGLETRFSPREAYLAGDVLSVSVRMTDPATGDDAGRALLRFDVSDPSAPPVILFEEDEVEALDVGGRPVGLGLDAAVGADGRIVSPGSLSAPFAQALFDLTDPSDPIVLLAGGDLVAPGRRIGDFAFEKVTLNARGQIAFFGSTDFSRTPSGFAGLIDVDGDVSPIWERFTGVETTDGRSLDFVISLGARNYLNDSGEVVFTVNHLRDDGTFQGLIVRGRPTLVDGPPVAPVPLPAGIGLLGLSLAFLAGLSRRGPVRRA